jgi:hypothetical protein
MRHGVFRILRAFLVKGRTFPAVVRSPCLTLSPPALANRKTRMTTPHPQLPGGA